MTNDTTIANNAENKAMWRDKLIPLILLLAVACLWFRPLFMHDFSEIKTGAENAMTNLLADLAAFAILFIALFAIVTGRIGSIAYNTFREAVRNRILYFILFFALILMGGSGVLKELAVSAHDRIVVDLGLACISFFGLLVAIFVGISLVYNELERRTIYTIVSKPIHRYQFLLGKFFGLLLTIYVIVAIMTCFFFAVINYQELTSDANVQQALTEAYQSAREASGDPHLAAGDAGLGWAQTSFIAKSFGLAIARGVGNTLGFGTEPVPARLLVVVAMICLELMIVTGIAILFSSFTTPTLSAVFTIMLFIAGRLNEDIIRLATRMRLKGFADNATQSMSDLPGGTQVKIWVTELVAVLVPNLDSLNLTSDVVHQETLNVWRYPVLYAFCYTGAVLMLAIVIFRRRNFK